MVSHVHIGVIGTSWWTDAMFLPSLRSHPWAELRAICGRNRERAEEMAEKHQIPKVFTDYRYLIEDGELDAVVVATPDDLHHQMTMDALDANLHVLCEKPMALNAGHAREMYDKAVERRLKHMVLFTWRWQPHFLFLKQLVDEGYIGRCHHADFYFLGHFGLEQEYLWRYDGLRSNGVISDLGAHLIDFARWYIGDIVKVTAQLDTFVERPGLNNRPLVPANDSASVNLQFDNGAQGTIRASAVANRGNRGIDMGMRFCGDSGTLEVEHIFAGPEIGGKVRGVRRDEGSYDVLEIPDVFFENISKGELFDPYVKQSAGPRLFIEAIVENRSITPNFYDGLKVQEVIDAALESHRKGCWVNLT